MNLIGPTSIKNLYRLALKVLLLVAAVSLSNHQSVKAQQDAPELFTYDELVQLYQKEELTAVLQIKLERLLTTPFVRNAAFARGIRPRLPESVKLGTFLRIVQWNVERGIEYEAIRSAFTDPTRFAT